MLSFYLKESLDITKIKDPEHSKESEVDFSGNLGRGVLLLSILFVIVYAILLVKFRRYIGAFEASLTPMIFGLISSILILPLHELLHAICISSKNNVQIYRVKSGLMTWFTAPITKRIFRNAVGSRVTVGIYSFNMHFCHPGNNARAYHLCIDFFTW